MNSPVLFGKKSSFSLSSRLVAGFFVASAFSMAVLSQSVAFSAATASAGGATASVDSSIVIPTNSSSAGNNGIFQGVGNGVNGSVDNSNLNSNSNNVTTGANNNQNVVQPIISAPAQAVGGSSALVLPRNALALPNAGLGRSNFGLQFGVNNNPVMSNIFGKGAGSALSWFMQGGVTVPFGKIPDIIANPRNAQMDDYRQQRLDNDRQVFGAVAPTANATVEGRVVSLNAYNYSTAASSKIGSLQDALKEVEGKAEANTPKVVALADVPVYTKPLNKGQKIAATVVGDEYRYIGHTSSGWLKLVLPDGRQGWVKGQFEYLKNDYTEVDSITAQNTLDNVREAMDNKQSKKLVSLNTRK